MAPKFPRSQSDWAPVGHDRPRPIHGGPTPHPTGSIANVPPQDTHRSLVAIHWSITAGIGKCLCCPLTGSAALVMDWASTTNHLKCFHRGPRWMIFKPHNGSSTRINYWNSIHHQLLISQLPTCSIYFICQNPFLNKNKNKRGYFSARVLSARNLSAFIPSTPHLAGLMLRIQGSAALNFLARDTFHINKH